MTKVSIFYCKDFLSNEQSIYIPSWKTMPYKIEMCSTEIEERVIDKYNMLQKSENTHWKFHYTRKRFSHTYSTFAYQIRNDPRRQFLKGKAENWCKAQVNLLLVHMPSVGQRETNTEAAASMRSEHKVSRIFDYNSFWSVRAILGKPLHNSSRIRSHFEAEWQESWDAAAVGKPSRRYMSYS